MQRGAHTIGSQLLSASVYRSQGEVEFDQGNSNVIEQDAGINLEGEAAGKLPTNDSDRRKNSNAS